MASELQAERAVAREAVVPHRRGRARLTAVAAGLAAVLTLAPAHAGASVRETAPGARWHAVTVDLAPGARWRATASARVEDLGGAAVCAGFVRDGDDDASAGAGMHWQRRDDTHLRVETQAIPMTPVHAGRAAGPSHGARPFGCLSEGVHRGARAIRSFVFVLASDGRLRRPAITFEARGPVRVLAVSRGAGSSLRREWDFRSAGSARGGIGGDCGVLAQAGGTIESRFRHRALAIFEAGTFSPAITVPGASGKEAPAILSVRGPERRTAAHAAGASYAANAFAFVGAPGDYRFGIEAAVAPACRTGAVGKDPYVVLATADVDFPACTTRGARVLARPRNGPVRCSA